MSTEFETHFDRLDREKQEQAAAYEKTRLVEEHKTKRAKLEARESTKELLIWIGGFLAGAAVLITLALVFWTDLGENPEQQPEVSEGQVEQQREEKCMESGGGWIPADTFSRAYPENGMCVHPGNVARKVAE